MHSWGGLGIEWKYATLIAVQLGPRGGDVFGLVWEQIDMDLRVITFEPSKLEAYKRILVLPIIDKLYSRLKEIHYPGATGRVFPTLGARSPASRSESFKILLQKANINVVAQQPSGTSGKRTVSDKCWHALRKALNMMLRNEGVNKEDCMGVLGDTTDSAYGHYCEENSTEAIAHKRQFLSENKALNAILDGFESLNAGEQSTAKTTFTAAEKVAILKLHMIQGKSAGSIQELFGVSPNVLKEWAVTLFQFGSEALTSAGNQ
jgi:hypothetical protein